MGYFVCGGALDLKSRLTQDLKKAMKDRNELLKLVIRSIKTEITYKEDELRNKLDDQDIEKVIASMIKSRKDSAEQYRQGDRLDLASGEDAEIELLQIYLPQQLSSEELQTIVIELKNELNASNMRDMGRLMKAVQEKAGSRADGKTIAVLVKTALS